MLRPVHAVLACFRRLAAARDGNIMLTFGLVAIPLVIAAGMAIDAARAYSVRVRLGTALDSAALAVGSETNQTATQLSDDLQHYFFANYPSTALGTNVSVTPVPANADMTATIVNYQATATVPMVFMQLVGINNITVTATAQTKKTTGLEVAVVLDNTGSMLCGASDSNCSSGVVTSDTTCTNAANSSRICTLINASTTFINTLTTAISSSQQLYISIVPYVTTVNVSALCPGGSCTHITTDSCSGDFTDLRGNILPTIPVVGDTTTASKTVSNVKPASSASTSTAAIYAGMSVSGTGIPTGTTVSSVSSSSITLNNTPTLTRTGNTLILGPNPTYTAPFTAWGITVTGNWTNGSKNVTSMSSTANITVGMPITGTGIAANTTVATIVSGTAITLSANATSTQTNKTLTIGGGATTNGSKVITGIKPATTGIVPGMAISGTGIPAGATISSVDSTTQITMSANATSTQAADVLSVQSWGGNTTNASNIVAGIKSSTTPVVGMVVSGNGIPANSTVSSVDTGASTFTTGAGQIHFCNGTTPNATATNNTALTFFSPITYDSAYNTASPAGSSLTTNWGGCVIEPTSTAENSGPSDVLATGTNPDTTEPSASAKWYPFWWPGDTTNNWPTVIGQSTATETQGNVNGEWLQQKGPNQGCPVPLVPLTDVTTTAGKQTILNTISSMWPRDAGGTQVHIGMVWGWRTLSPTGPFAANNGHPLSYSDATTTGWKKVVVLMTDGEEEWPATDNMTGLGQIADGKIGTINSGTAVTNLGTRLTSVCTNMAAQGYIIYTIGLGPAGSSNTALQACAANGGFYEAATPSNLQKVFNDIAKSLIALRLSQ